MNDNLTASAETEVETPIYTLYFGVSQDPKERSFWYVNLSLAINGEITQTKKSESKLAHHAATDVEGLLGLYLAEYSNDPKAFFDQAEFR